MFTRYLQQVTVLFLRDGRWPKESSNLAYLEVNNGKLDKDPPWDFENETRDERARVVFALEEDDGFLEWKDKIPPKVYRPLGCVWMETEKSPQQDQTKRLDKEIKNEALSAALQTKTVFSQQELDNFKLGTLSDGSFIMVQDRCFEPAETVETRFKRLQQDAYFISYLLQRVQIEADFIFFVGSPASSGVNLHDKKDNGSKAQELKLGPTKVAPEPFPVEPVPECWEQIGMQLQAWSVPGTVLGEVKWIALQFAVVYLPLLAVYVLFVNLYYSSLREKGMAIHGTNPIACVLAIKRALCPFLSSVSIYLSICRYHRTVVRPNSDAGLSCLHCGFLCWHHPSQHYDLLFLPRQQMVGPQRDAVHRALRPSIGADPSLPLSLVSALACLLWYGDACGRVLRQQLLFYERFNPQQEPAAAPKSAPKSQRDERFWYRTHTLVHDTQLFWFFLLYVLLSFTATLIGVWILLGMFLEPQRVAPFGNNLTM